MLNWENISPADLALAFHEEHTYLSMHVTRTERAIVRKYASMIRSAPAGYVLELARQLLYTYAHRWQAYELIAGHNAAFKSLGVEELQEFGCGINSWWSADSFARTLSGPAWREGLVPDGLFASWASSPDFWWRRAALVSTVAFNTRSQGGEGDTQRTLAICHMLADDHEDMVVKALSWALRALVYFNRRGVEDFLRVYDGKLAGRVKREVGSKLRTGLKNPKKK